MGCGYLSCPERALHGNPYYEVWDRWRVMDDDTRTCSHCGSLHPEDFISILKYYSLGKPGYRYEPTLKSYKVYANTPGTTNASEGGIKFYFWHMTPQYRTVKYDKIIYEAERRYKEDFNKRWGTGGI